MGMPVPELLARMTSTELAEWMAYFLLGSAEEGEQEMRAQIAELKGQK